MSICVMRPVSKRTHNLSYPFIDQKYAIMVYLNSCQAINWFLQPELILGLSMLIPRWFIISGGVRSGVMVSDPAHDRVLVTPRTMHRLGQTGTEEWPAACYAVHHTSVAYYGLAVILKHTFRKWNQKFLHLHDYWLAQVLNILLQ